MYWNLAIRRIPYVCRISLYLRCVEVRYFQFQILTHTPYAVLVVEYVSLTLLIVQSETEDVSDEEAIEGEYYNAKNSMKKGRKKEARQATRQVSRT